MQVLGPVHAAVWLLAHRSVRYERQCYQWQRSNADDQIGIGAILELAARIDPGGSQSWRVAARKQR